ncbi:Ferric reduction oxidase 2 [Sesamum alatum]|uniref:ferric-chelate reductase (NADH) n=1 Tax=Sesamum alatum TaxID=300844 RepID=A0AAE1YK27_9LAMI|nr:Ferric reduction oxidase 2 [Sesamum alatum]
MKFRRAWQIFFLLVFVGYMFIWAMLPTKTYKNSWTPKLNEKLNSTYFREQGTNLLLFSFPLMLIAALGCVYLHLQKTSNSEGSKSCCRSLRRPATVMAPLGIVNAVELTFAAMFVALLIWSLANYLYVSFQKLYMDTPNATAIGFIIYWAMTDQMFLMLQWSSTYLSNVAGVIAFVLSLGMWVTSIDRIFLFLIDRYLRFLQSRRRTRLVSTRPFPNGSMELSFAKDPELSYNPTSILFVHVPSICKLQWHPFTVVSSSNLERDKLSVVIKSQGSWTQKLYKQLSSSLDHLEVSTEGPYGPASSHFLSGGSGITPFISLIREIIFRSTESKGKVPKVLLITAFKNTTDLTMLDLLLPLSGTPLDISKLQLRIEAYITQEHESPLADAKKQIETKLFKPNPSDLPISEVLGKNSWLWLGAIISSSFVMFLILLGFVTRYHIYLVERKGENYHYSFKILWDMFLVCACIIIATSAIFLWQKRKLSADGKQIQNVDLPTPTMSPSSWLCGSDRELESLPTQFLVQSTNVHFGARPDLKSAYILIYSFPVLLIATLGCLYLHLDKYIDENENRTPRGPRFASWRQPVLLRGPLGIVSWMELSFLVMFVALLVWSVSAYVHSMFKNITRQSASKMGELVWEVKLDSVALLLGLVGNVCLSFLFFPVTRGSPILRLVRLTSESTVKYHIWLGHTALTLFTAHGLCYVIFWANTHQMSEMLKWSKVGISNVAGEVALLSGLAMWITSSSVVRRKLFELFFYTHHLYIVFVLFFVLHVGFSYSCTMLPGFYLFLIDRFLRFLQSQQRVRLISARVLPCQTVELNFSKDPITSNTNTDPDQLSIVIKSEGSWSQKLYEKLSSPTPIDHLDISVEGPYSPTSTSFLRHEMLVLVSGGSGITPFISIIRELVFLASTNKKTPRILLVAVFKKSADLTMLDLLLPLSGTSHDISRLQLQIQAHVTRDRSPSTDSQKLPQSIWLKPSVVDRSVSAVLGSKSWLWLGAIILASFIIFLLLIGMLNHYYIYPVDHNTNMIYPYAARSMISTVFLCVSVVIAATLAFIWNKKQNMRDTRQIQDSDSPTPMSCPVPESWRFNVERELESILHRSFKQVTTVRYGERPNLQRILSQYNQYDVGVLVSGPKKMREDVAGICSSDKIKSLHYRSFSFNW